MNRSEPDRICACYDILCLALERLEHDIHKGATRPPSDLAFLTSGEISERFVAWRRELEMQVTLTLVASFEGVLQVDFQRRTNRREGHGPVDRRFREVLPDELKSSDRPWVRDVLRLWLRFPLPKEGPVRRFLMFLDLRNWLAHGRYSPQPSSPSPSPHGAYAAGSELIGLLEQTVKSLR